MKRFCTMVLFLLSSLQVKSQIINTVAGGGTSLSSGIPAKTARLLAPSGGVVDRFGNFYFFDNKRILRLGINDSLYIVAGTGRGGFSGDGGPATAADIHPQGFCLDTAGNIYIADFYNYRLRRVDAVTGIISTIAGTGRAACRGDGGPATAADLLAYSVCVDRIGNIYLIDSGGAKVRKIDTTGTIRTNAGNSTPGYSGDGGPASAASLALTYGICVDTFGNLYLPADRYVRRIDASTSIITTIAGNGSFAYVGDGMRADSAQFSIFVMTLDKFENIYISDLYNDRVYKIDTFGIFHLVAGTGFYSTFAGDGGAATAASLYDPEGATADDCGNIYIADGANNRIRKVWLSSTPSATISVVGSADSACEGRIITYSASFGGGGSTRNYAWYVNSVLKQYGTTSTFTDSAFTPDSVYCILTTSNRCQMPYVDTSNVVVVPVVARPAISISGATVAAIGSNVTIDASVIPMGTRGIFHWFNNGSRFATTHGPTVSYIKSLVLDSITVRFVSTTNRCIDSVMSGVHLVYDHNLSVLPVSESQTITYYPNPVMDVLTLDVQDGPSSYLILNCLGDIVRSGLLTEGRNQINLESIPVGVYVMKAMLPSHQLILRVLKN